MYQTELSTAVQLSLEAGEMARKLLANPLEVLTKQNNSPVTNIDKALNDFLVAGLQKAFPGDAVIAEESVPLEGENQERVWYVDPIDGTKELIKKNGEWSIMVGLADNKQAVLGIVYHVEKQSLYAARKGDGAKKHRVKNGSIENTQDIHAIGVEQNQAIMVKSRSHPNPREEELQAHLGIEHSITHGSVGIKMSLIAEGKGHLYINDSGRCHLWDLCAGDAILSEAGGRVLDCSQLPIDYSCSASKFARPFIAGTPELVRAALSSQ